MLVGAIADISDDGHYLDIQDNVRFISVATRCQEARVKKGINIKGASFVLKIPQYRLKAIEDGGISRICSNDLNAYVKYIGLYTWYKRWKCENKVLVKKYGLI